MIDAGMPARTFRACKCQRLVTQAQSHMGCETDSAKREGRMTGHTLKSCLTHSPSDCQSLDTSEAPIHHFIQCEISAQPLIIFTKYGAVE